MTSTTYFSNHRKLTEPVVLYFGECKVVVGWFQHGMEYQNTTHSTMVVNLPQVAMTTISYSKWLAGKQSQFGD